MTPLYPYQADAVARIAAAPQPVLNGFDPGLGKSRVAIEVLRGKGFQRVLVFCPNSVLLVWREEVKRWWPGGPPVNVVAGAKVPDGEGFFLVPYGLVSEASGKVAKSLADTGKFQATILDEAHYLKNPRSNRSKRVFALLPRLGWVHPMTGTPAPNHAGELWGIVHKLRPDLIASPLSGRPMSESEFMNRYCAVRHFRVNGRMIEQVTGSKNLPDLRARLAPMLLKARKRDVLPDLPPLDFVVLPCVPTPYLLPREKFDHLDDDSFLGELDQIMPAHTRQQVGLAKIRGLCEWIADLLDADPNRRLALWAVHHQVIDAYVDNLAQYKPVKFDGRDNLAQRASAVQRFMSGDAKIFIGQIQAGGTGLTLVSKSAPCSDVLFAEASFSPADNYQAACRVHRIGQHDGVLVRYAAAAGTIDDRIQAILARKSRELSELFE